MHCKLFFLFAATVFLPGCITSPPQELVYYSLPPDAPFATINNQINHVAEGKGHTFINVLNADCNSRVDGRLKHHGRLFTNRDLKSTPEGPQKIVASGPIGLQYGEVIYAPLGGRNGYCGVEGKVALKPGKSYTLIAGPRTKFGPIPFFTDKSMCTLGVKDDESGKYLPIENFACSQTK